MPEVSTGSHPVLALMAGRYELVRELDGASDLQCWEGFDTALERRVLLEFLPYALAHDPVEVDRFWQSARVTARSSTVVGERVLDAQTDPETGRGFVVREWAPRHTPVERETTSPIAAQSVRESAWGQQTRFARTKLPLVALALVAAGAVLILRPAVEGWLFWVNEPLAQVTQRFELGPPPEPATQPTSGPISVSTPAARATALAAPTTAPTPAATRTPTAAAGVRRRIVNTDGRGVALRSSPGGDRLPGKGYDEGATVQAFESSGEWTRIQGADGRQGWVLSVTLSR